MIYLTGAHTPEAQVSGHIGLMMTPAIGYSQRTVRFYRYWAADNGCYSRGDSFNLDTFLSWLDTMTPLRSSCLFAVAPDVFGDGRATWEQSRDVLPLIRQLGYRAALVAQPGLDEVVIDWDAFDAVFLGGPDEWKENERMWEFAEEANRRGKWLHNGRVNSLSRLRLSAMHGWRSADGTFLRFGPRINIKRLERWFDALSQQPALPLWEMAS